MRCIKNQKQLFYFLKQPHYRYILYKHNAGETVELTYIRGSETKTTKVTLTERTE